MVRFIRRTVSSHGEPRVVVEDARTGRLRELAPEKVRQGESHEQRKQRRLADRMHAWSLYFGELGEPDPWWVSVKHSELPVELQRRDSGMRGRALVTITEKSWRESCSGMTTFSEIMAWAACMLGRNLVETRRGLYNAAFGQTYAAQAALGRPLQRAAELFREYVRVHTMISIHEFIAYQCLAFLEKQALPAEKGNTARTEALNKVVRGLLRALEAEEDPATLVDKVCAALDEEDRLLQSREVAQPCSP